MEEQRLYLLAAARGGRPRGHEQERRRRRRTMVVCGGQHQEGLAACFGVSRRARGGIGGGVTVREGGGG